MTPEADISLCPKIGLPSHAFSLSQTMSFEGLLKFHKEINSLPCSPLSANVYLVTAVVGI